MQQVIVEPKNSRGDEPVYIKVVNLNSKQKITIQSSTINDAGKDFMSFAYYEADKFGIVDLSVAPSAGGYFTGIEPMGLIWTLKRCSGDGFSTLYKYDVRATSSILLNVYDDHVDIEKLGEMGNCLPLTLTSTTFERRYMDDNIERVILKTGDLRGVLFIPREPGQFLGVIDINGAVGGMNQQRGALLANHGFIVMCLSLFRSFDQPKIISSIDLEYVERGINFLLKHDKVQKDGVAFLGLSLGGTVGMAAAGYLKNLKCVVNISGAIIANSGFHYNYKERHWKSVVSDANFRKIVDNAHYMEKVVQIPEIDKLFDHIPDFSKSKASMLFIYGSDDCLMDWRAHASLVNKIFTSEKKKNYRIIVYPDSGHLFAPPYVPVLSKTFYAEDSVAIYGGTPKGHCLGQINAWNDIIRFLKENSFPLSKLC